MRSSALPTAVLALAVLVAGCAGVGTQSPAETTTDAPDATTRAETTATEDGTAALERAPGLSESGVESPDALASSHRDRLADRSLTLAFVRVERAENGTVLSRTERTIRAASNRSNYRVTESVSGREPAFLGGAPGRLELWANGTHVFRALTVNGSTSYGLVTDAQSSPAEPRDRLRGELSLGDDVSVLFTAFGDERVERVGRERNLTAPISYRITATELAYPDLLGASDATARNASLSAVVEVDGASRVDESGDANGANDAVLVRNYTVRYTTTIDGETVRVTERVRFSDRGRTSVEPPSWATEVRNRT